MSVFLQWVNVRRTIAGILASAARPAQSIRLDSADEMRAVPELC